MIDFLTANYLWIAAVVFLVAMRQDGGCGGHHRHRDHGDQDTRPTDAAGTEVGAPRTPNVQREQA